MSGKTNSRQAKGRALRTYNHDEVFSVRRRPGGASSVAARANKIFPLSAMSHPSAHDPLHGVTLEKILQELVERHGWEELGQRIDIRCFNFDPSIKSSLKFLRKTPWARTKVEALYVHSRAGRGGAGNAGTDS
jgi:hypothetical protein